MGCYIRVRDEPERLEKEYLRARTEKKKEIKTKNDFCAAEN
jgi:hypothetical protein